MKMKNKENSSNDDFEYGIDSRYKSNKEREKDSIALMEARLNRMKNVSKLDILRARLMQLKLKMEDYLKTTDIENQHIFGQFLKIYIDTIYLKRNDFATDINVTSNYLSKIINHHREPNEEFILKLMIHSEKTFKLIGHFYENTWFQIYFHEKLCKTLSNQEKWRPNIENQVKFSARILEV
jgi:hypothetical protein